MRAINMDEVAGSLMKVKQSMAKEGCAIAILVGLKALT